MDVNPKVKTGLAVALSFSIIFRPIPQSEMFLNNCPFYFHKFSTTEKLYCCVEPLKLNNLFLYTPTLNDGGNLI